MDPREATDAAAQTASRTVREVGDFIREQRSQAQLSLRKLARMADVSDPYLSQIERGLRRPSADVLQRIADALQMRAETLYYKAGILAEPTDDLAVRIAAEPTLTEPQKRALIEVYESFRASGRPAPDDDGAGSPSEGVTADGATPDGATPDGATPDGATPDGATPDGVTSDGDASGPSRT